MTRKAAPLRANRVVVDVTEREEQLDGLPAGEAVGAAGKLAHEDGLGAGVSAAPPPPTNIGADSLNAGEKGAALRG